MADRPLSRRAFLRSTLLGGAGLAAAYTLGCGDGNDNDGTPSKPTATLPVPTAPPLALGWTARAASGTLPEPRRDHSLSSDGAGLYLFGGRGDGTFADFWQYDPTAEAWTELAPTGPSPRFGHNAAWHKLSNRLIVFGGQSGDGTFVNDLWTYDPATDLWTQLDSGSGPSPRYGAASALTVDGQLIVTHGFTDQGRFNDTWRYDFDAGTWTDISPPGQRPIERCLTRAAWTEVMDQHLLMFGGQTNDAPFLGDFWALAEGRDWSEVVRVPHPGARNQYSMVYDATGHRIVMFGGDSEGGPLNDLWTFDADDEFWTNTIIDGANPSARYGHDAAWVASRSAMLVFGGHDGQSELNDLWELARATA